MNIILQYGKAHKNEIFVSGMIRPSDQSKPPLLTEEGLEKEGMFFPVKILLIQ
ncbi:MAG: hypothetical protein WBL44_08625 [Nitrososphaeraceae archaeon]|jgi:hypothetical protein